MDFHCANLGWVLGRYYCYGVENNIHRGLALEWSGALSSNVRVHLLGSSFNAEGIQGSFDLQATKDMAQAMVGSDG